MKHQVGQPIELHKFFAGPLAVKAAGDGDVEIEAILSEVGVVDLDGDVILPGAFDKAIEAKATPDTLYMHRRGEIIGQWRELRMDGTKLVAKSPLYTGEGGFDLARRAVRLINTGQLKGVSVGFRVIAWTNVRTEERPYGWDISELELIEASLVDKPANESAQVTEIKRKLFQEAAGLRLPDTLAKRLQI